MPKIKKEETKEEKTCKCAEVKKLEANFSLAEVQIVVEKLNEVIEAINKC